MPPSDDEISGTSPSGPEQDSTAGGLTPGHRRRLSQDRTATIDTGACGKISVTVEPQDFGQMGVAGWNNVTDFGGVPIRTNFDGLGPYGGGDNYTDTVPLSEADVTATTAGELETAVQDARKGQVIYLTEDIDIGGDPIVIDTDEVTLASDRGIDGSGGAIIERSSTGGGGQAQAPALRLIGEAIRVSGLQFEGPRPNEFTPRDRNNPPHSTGIWIEGGGCEVDNCSIREFSTSAISISEVMTAAIHHNRIRDIGMSTHGYAVFLDQPSQLVGGGCGPAVSEDDGGSNTVMADGGGPSWSSDGGGSGTTTTRSIVTYMDIERVQSAVYGTGDGASFTFKKSRVGPVYGRGVVVEDPGGYRANIRHCTFESTAGNENVYINGVPSRESTIEKVWHHESSRQLAIRQAEEGTIIADAGRGGFEKISVVDNMYGQSRPGNTEIGAQEYGG